METHKSQFKAYLFAASAVLLWSTVATAFKLTLRTIGFVEMLFWASLFSTLILFIMVYIRMGKTVFSQLTVPSLLRSALMGALNPFLYYLVLFRAYSLLPAQIAQPLNYTWPIALVVLSAVFLRKKLTLRELASLTVSFSGVVVVSMARRVSNMDISVEGIVLAILSAFIWSAYWILNLKDEREAGVKLFSNFLMGSVFVAVVAFLFTSPLSVPMAGIAGSFYIGAFEMGITFFVWLKALELAERQPPVANLIYLSPFLSLIFIHTVLGERILPTTILGLLLIVAGIIMQKR